MGREFSRLKGATTRSDPQAEVDGGRAFKEKVEGIWLYFREPDDLDRCIESVRAFGLAVCQDWFIAPMRPLAGVIAKDSEASATMEAVRPILRGLVRSGEFGVVPSLTLDYEPQVALTTPPDFTLFRGLVDHVIGTLHKHGFVDESDIDPPRASIAGRAWKSTLLHHIEWLGEGYLDSGTLWPMDQP